jgi:hypothetical protein
MLRSADLSRGHKFAERRHPAVSSTSVVVRDADLLALRLRRPPAGLASDLPRRLVFLLREATPAGHPASAVDDRSVPRVEQALRATSCQWPSVSHQRKAPLSLERLGSQAWPLVSKPESLMAGIAWSYSVNMVVRTLGQPRS